MIIKLQQENILYKTLIKSLKIFITNSLKRASEISKQFFEKIYIVKVKKTTKEPCTILKHVWFTENHVGFRILGQTLPILTQVNAVVDIRFDDILFGTDDHNHK